MSGRSKRDRDSRLSATENRGRSELHRPRSPQRRRGDRGLHGQEQREHGQDGQRYADREPRDLSRRVARVPRGRWALVGVVLAALVVLAGGYLVMIAFQSRSTVSPLAVVRPPVLPSPRSSPASSGPLPSSDLTPTPSPHPSAASGVVLTFPVIGQVSYNHAHHDYPATDILTKCGNPVVAVTDGMVLDTSTIDTWDPRINAGRTRGGLSVSILGDDGVRYYGSHLSRVDPGIKPGVRVTVGQRLGDVGETGDASACHLHFGISPPCSRVGDWWIQRGVVWPWPYLDSWRQKGVKSPVAEVASWLAAKGCPRMPLTDP